MQAEKESPPASLSQVELIKEDVSAIKQQLGRVLSNQCSILDSLAKLSDGSCAPPSTYPFFSPLPIPDFLSFNPPMESTGGATQTGLGNTTIPSLVNQPFCPSQIPLSQPTFQVTPHASVEQDQLNDTPYPGMPPSPQVTPQNLCQWLFHELFPTLPTKLPLNLPMKLPPKLPIKLPLKMPIKLPPRLPIKMPPNW